MVRASAAIRSTRAMYSSRSPGFSRARNTITSMVLFLSCGQIPALRGAQSENPFDDSHVSISPATWSLFLSIIIMCELPLIPRSGRSTKSTLPPALFNAFAYSTSADRSFAQRGCPFSVSRNHEQDGRVRHRENLVLVSRQRRLDCHQCLDLVRTR